MFKKRFKRRQYIINPAFQLKISGIIVGTLLMATFITAVFLYVNILNSVLPEFSADKLEQKMKIANQLKQRQIAQYGKVNQDRRMFDVLFPETSEMLADYEMGVVVKILHQVNRNLVPWILILVALILAAGIFLSHRIAGPIYSIKKSFGEIKDGNLVERIHLRWSDEFKDFAKGLNEYIATIDESTSEYKALTKKIKELNNSLEESLNKPQPDTKKIENTVSEIKNKLSQLEKQLNYYKTSSDIS